MLKEAGGAASQEKLSKLVSVNMASSAGDSSLYWTLIGVLTIFCQGVCAQKTPTIGFISPDVVADIGKIGYNLDLLCNGALKNFGNINIFVFIGEKPNIFRYTL